MTLRRDLDKLARTAYDLVIVGGGIYGVCAAWAASRRGLACCLLERGDFGEATSSRSLKIVHGGLRYLQHLDLRRMRQSIGERRVLLRLAPHLVRPLPFVVPTRGRGVKGKAAHRVALLLNDLVGFDRNRDVDPKGHLPPGRVLSREELLELCPGLPERGVTGGALWYDAQARSTERLLLAFLLSATRAGADVANYVEATGAIARNRRIEGVAARDVLTGRALEVRGRVVLNAAGPWVDAFLERVVGGGATRRFLPSRGMNLVLRRRFGEHALGLEGAAGFRDADALVGRGTRLFFLVPWGAFSLAGTKHLPHEDDVSDCRIEPEEVRAFLAEINAAYPPAAVSEEDVIAVHSGFLPEKPARAGGDVQLQKHPRLIDHAREEGLEGLVTVVGVKWTTARRVAEDAVGLVQRKLGRPRTSPTRVEETPLAGGAIKDLETFRARGLERRPGSVSRESMEHLLLAHGTDVEAVLRRARNRSSLGRPVVEGAPVIGAQVIHAAEEEMAMRLADIVLRRTELWLAAPREADLERCASLVAPVLGWGPERVREEVDAVLEALGRFAPEAASPERP